MRTSVCAVLLLAVGCSRQPSEPAPVTDPPRPAPVKTIVVEPRDHAERITSFGVFESTGEVDVAVDFSAQVASVHFDQGMRVEAGQLLVAFDPRERELRQQRAAAVRDAALAELEEARAALARKRQLVAGGVESGVELASAELAARSAQARYEDAVAALALAERELQRMRLVSPVAGSVAQRSVDPGETPAAGSVLAVIETSDTVRVITYVGQKDINHLRIGAEAAVTTPAVRGRTLPARIESLGVKADPRTGNFEVRLALPNEDGLLRPGMTARVELSGMVVHGALLVPDRAIVDRDRRKVLFKVVDGAAVRVEPVLLPGASAWVPVLDGLVAGDVVITGGLQHVVDGSPVRIAAENR